MKKRSTLLVLASILVASCGGGGGDASTSTSSPSGTTVQGSVIDGPIEGARVFLDLNNNFALDQGEPVSNPTGSNGAYSLFIPQTVLNNLNEAILVSLIDSNAKDLDDLGQTLAQAGRGEFMVARPFDIAEAGQPNTLNPFGFMVASEMVNNSLGLDIAKQRVASFLNIPEEDLLSNYAAQGDDELGVIARTYAIALGELKRTSADDEAFQLALQELKNSVRSIVDQVRQNPGRSPSEVPVTEIIQAFQNRTSSGTPPTFSPGAQASNSQMPEAGKVDLIVVFKESTSNPGSEAQNAAAADNSAQIRYVYERVVKGFAVRINENAEDAFLDAMSRNPNVDYVERDSAVATTLTTQSNATFGLDRVDQQALPLSGSYTYEETGVGVHAYIVDSGILASHQNFGGRVLSGYTSIADGNGTSDCNGHGTHVAGTVGSTTYGVAKQVNLIPVRVLDCNGSGTSSTVIAGLDWIAANGVKPAVVNMSLGGAANSSLDNAVSKLISLGYPVVVAAGNSNADACNYSPARVAGAITVGATTSADERSSFSNFGSCLDLFAPGSGITSTWISSNTATATASGTSMAAPHVAGFVANLLQSQPMLSSADASNTIVLNATSGVLSNIVSGSPNLLLYTIVNNTVTEEPVSTLTVYVDALTGSAAAVRNGWQASARITVKDSNGNAVSGATVSGDFTVGGTGLICQTASNGSCSVASGKIHNRFTQTTFSVTEVKAGSSSYNSALNTSSSVLILKP